MMNDFIRYENTQIIENHLINLRKNLTNLYKKASKRQRRMMKDVLIATLSDIFSIDGI